MIWEPPPEPIEWPLPVPVQVGPTQYTKIVLRAPTGADVLKAIAIPAANNLDVSVKLIEAVSGVPADVIRSLPGWVINQMAAYLDEFNGAPAPDPLEQWRERRRAAILGASLTGETPAAN